MTATALLPASSAQARCGFGLSHLPTSDVCLERDYRASCSLAIGRPSADARSLSPSVDAAGFSGFCPSRPTDKPVLGLNREGRPPSKREKNVSRSLVSHSVGIISQPGLLACLLACLCLPPTFTSCPSMPRSFACLDRGMDACLATTLRAARYLIGIVEMGSSALLYSVETDGGPACERSLPFRACGGSGRSSLLSERQ